MTLDEKKELEQLRIDIIKYRKLDEENKHHNLDNSLTDEEEDDIDEQIEKKVVTAKVRLSKQREGVSAEAYGVFNKKADFKPHKVEKSEDQIQRIKTRVLQSFLFAALESKDLSIIIDTMAERKLEAGETVITQGENGDCLYVVESGDLDCYKWFVRFLINILDQRRRRKAS
jgi:cAMP-dependent protein kinase regulator